MKKVIIGIAIIAAVTFLVWKFVFATESSISTTLSDRAKAYISGRKAAGDTTWQGIQVDPAKNLQPSAEASGNEDIKNRCFNVRIPFSIDKFKKPAECDLNITTVNPVSRIVISHREVSIQKLDELPDVQFRRNSAKEYAEKQHKSSKYTFLTFQKLQDFGYEKSAYYFHGKNVIIITISSPSNRNFDASFEEILNSFEYLL